MIGMRNVLQKKMRGDQHNITIAIQMRSNQMVNGFSGFFSSSSSSYINFAFSCTNFSFRAHRSRFSIISTTADGNMQFHIFVKFEIL